ncbi:hypothetical protein [Streptomyces varsoviensis]|uniref:Uncharacterized protein n=1 Tax=Streptomyces varsoviensis TaxID=67373 RepID=A0ABR5J6U1_9ACTN|nr:hypothetical protein [Streptomyces varsoviensis]KOG89120.1 hypothetical protein ADK38_16035 [Streptomyces varsoviensis]
MWRTRTRQLGLSAIIALALGLFGLGQPALATAADNPPITFSVDKPTATPGTTVSISMTFTNPEATYVRFAYQSLQPTWETVSYGMKFNFLTCKGDASVCEPGGAVNYTAPIAPGASRTVTMTYEVAADSPCVGNGTIGFYAYLHYEFDNGKNAKDGSYFSPTTAVQCAPSGAKAAHSHA